MNDNLYSRELTVTTIPVSELPQLQRHGDLGQLLKSDKKFGESDFGGPKHGKVDASGSPHVGGNTWAGGSGGRDTAGLGGVGGPYRLDSGNAVFQVNNYNMIFLECNSSEHHHHFEHNNLILK